MATRSTISRVNEDNSVDTIYCHWDGYPTCVGNYLYFNYNTPQIVDKLIGLGGISSLRKYLEKDSTNSEDDVTIAYHRDLNDDDLETIHYNSIDEYHNDINNKQEWNYLYKKGNWYVSKGISNKFSKLSKYFINKTKF